MAIDMAIVDAIITMPMIRMNGCPLVKKKTTEPPIPSVGSNCISTLSCWLRGSSGGGWTITSPAGTSGGSARGGRFTTIWLTAHQFPCRPTGFAVHHPVSGRRGPPCDPTDPLTHRRAVGCRMFA